MGDPESGAGRGKGGQEKYLYSRGHGGREGGERAARPFFDDGAGRWRARERETGPLPPRGPVPEALPAGSGNRGRRAGWG